MPEESKLTKINVLLDTCSLVELAEVQTSLTKKYETKKIEETEALRKRYEEEAKRLGLSISFGEVMKRSVAKAEKASADGKKTPLKGKDGKTIYSGKGPYKGRPIEAIAKEKTKEELLNYLKKYNTNLPEKFALSSNLVELCKKDTSSTAAA